MSEEICEICHKENFKYTCPRCNLIYCSVTCYKSAQHLKCSEDFYKSCIQEQFTTAEPNSREDIQKMYEILKRIREFDAGVGPEDFDDGLEAPLDSDDDVPFEQGEEKSSENDEEDIATRLQGIDINDADEVWGKLTQSERKDFQEMVERGDITKLLPDYQPWWKITKQSKIVDLSVKAKENEEGSIPAIVECISKFSDIFKKEPSPFLHYNLWNIIAAYACIVRFFYGEQQTTPGESSAYFVNLSATLKYNTNFESVEEALHSVEVEASTTGRGADQSNMLMEGCQQLEYDARQIMSKNSFKLSALSDVLRFFQSARNRIKSDKGKESEFHRLFALRSGSIELDRKKLQQFIKKIEFYLSYVNREQGSNI